jgi:hypothetical protein
MRTTRSALRVVLSCLLARLSDGFQTSNKETCLVPPRLVHSSNLRLGIGGDHNVPINERTWSRPIPSSELEKSKGVMYRQSILSNDELSCISSEVSALKSQLCQETSSIAQHRLGASLHPVTSPTVQVLRDGSLCRYVRKCTGDETMNLATDIPVQLRSYEKYGASMAWHVDDVLYDPPQVEIVLTLENTSDCVTMWKVGDRVQSIETDPNSVLLLQAGGPLHCVTSLKKGRRLILKCAYVSSHATFLQDRYTHQFPMTGNTHKKSVQKSKKNRKS